MNWLASFEELALVWPRLVYRVKSAYAGEYSEEAAILNFLDRRSTQMAYATRHRHRLKNLATCLVCALLLVHPFTACAGDEKGSPVREVAANPSLVDARAIDLIVPKSRDGYRELGISNGEKRGVDWNGLAWQSGFFLGVQHGFRLATEPGTRAGMKGPFFREYVNSIRSLHGWSDQDPFYVNYVGHPMQGAVSGFIWTHSDRDFQGATFSGSSYYWKSRLRAAAFTFAYSALFEIGPVSEASIGNVQSIYPQHGFVDHVVTPVIGTGWQVGEDALDRYVVIPLERKFKNSYARLFLRAGLNPARSFANAMRFKVPWVRDDRPGVFSPELSSYHADYQSGLIRRPELPPREIEGEYGVSSAEVSANFRTLFFNMEGRTVPCTGGGGGGSFRVSRQLQLLVDVSGCKVGGMENYESVDALIYLGGLRWSPRPSSRWDPYLQVKTGGMKVTAEWTNPELKAALLATQREARRPAAEDYQRYATKASTNKLTLSVGGGVQFRIQPALSVKLLDVEYLHTGERSVNGYTFGNGFTVGAGLDLRMGSW